MSVLTSIGDGAYRVVHRTLNSEDSGAPHHRERVFIVGTLKACAGPSFEFPESLARRPLSALLEPPNSRIDNVLSTSASARANLKEACAKLVSEGVVPEDSCFVIDVDASARFRSVMLERSPCLLKSRGAGYYVTLRRRRLVLAEICRLQGFAPFSSTVVSTAALIGMLGNAMTKTVASRILRSLLPAIGISIFNSSASLRSLAGRTMPMGSPRADSALLDGFQTALLRAWVHAVVDSGVPFGIFCHEFINGEFPTSSIRHRDVLPLPVVANDDLDEWSPSIGRTLGHTLVNLVVAGLNFLFLDGASAPIPRASTVLHRRIFGRIRCLLDEALAELPFSSDSHCGASGAFLRMTGRTSAEKYPSLRAHDVDLLPQSALVDPMAILPTSTKSVLTDPALLFPAGVDHLPAVRTSRESNHGDQVSLIIRSLRAGKLGLSLRPAASADSFVVGKHDSAKLREVWNGSLLTEAAARAPKPPLQACPAALGTLEATDDDPLLISCRDGRAFFDQLRLPDELRKYFGRAQVKVRDLMEPPQCESGGPAVGAMTRAEIDSFLIDGAFAGDVLTPVNLCFPMGFGWSSYVAQETMLASVLRTGFRAEEVLSSEHIILPEALRSVAVATDDVHLFSKCHTCDQLNDPPLQALDEEWERCGIIGHPDKRVDNQLNGRVLGMEFREGKRIQTRGSKLLALIEAALDLSTVGSCSPGEMAVLNGHLQWQNLVNRPMYSCLDLMYPFVHLLPEGRPRPIPEGVLSEVFHNISLFCFWSADLCRPWWDVLPATDASPSFGYGMSLATPGHDTVRAVSAASADPHHYIRLAHMPGDPAEVPRSGAEYRTTLCMDDFKDVFSIRASFASHSGAMELQAVKLALLRLTRSGRMLRSRGAILVDAQAVCGALAKGRSSAATLKRGVKAVAAISIACELRLHFPYIPSESNPADFPSRGKVKKRALKSRRHRQPIATSIDVRLRAYRLARRRFRECGHSDLASSSGFDSSISDSS